MCIFADLKAKFRTAARTTDRDAASAAMISVADSWEREINEDEDEALLAMVMPLTRNYGSGERGLQRLVDWDAARVAAMRRSGRFGFAFLAVDCVVEGSPMVEDMRDQYRHERDAREDEDEDEDFHEMDFVYDQEFTVIASDQEPSRGPAIDFKSLVLDYAADVAMVDDCKVFCCDPEEEVLDGGTLLHTFHRTAVVFWPLATASKLPQAAK